jgi:hypothetical protein
MGRLNGLDGWLYLVGGQSDAIKTQGPEQGRIKAAKACVIKNGEDYNYRFRRLWLPGAVY